MKTFGESSRTYVDDDVTLSLRTRPEAHVSGCGGCRAIYDGIRNVIQLISTGEILELPEGFSQRLYRRLTGTTIH